MSGVVVAGLRPSVDWFKHDRDDGDTSVSRSTIRRDYREPIDNEPRAPRVYRATLPLALLRVELWETLDGGTYDWGEYHQEGVYPPIKVLIGARHRPRCWIKDGNHRVQFWRECGFVLAPAWVLDYTVEGYPDGWAVPENAHDVHRVLRSGGPGRVRAARRP